MRDENKNHDRLAALFLLGLVLFNPLVVGIFDAGAETTVFGIPLFFLYLFAAWTILIGLTAVVTENDARHGKRDSELTPLEPDRQ